MSDNEFSIPFERAFKRLRVDGGGGGGLPADADDSDGEDCCPTRDNLAIQPNHRPNNSALTTDDVPCTSTGHFSSSSKMWRPTVDKFADRPVNAEVPSFLDHSFKSAINTASYQHKTVNSQRSMDDRSIESQSNKPSISSLLAKPVLSSNDHMTNDHMAKDHMTKDRMRSDPLTGDLKRIKVKSSSNTELAQNCSNQARNEADINVNELAAYLDCQLFLPKKMSFMASLAYS